MLRAHCLWEEGAEEQRVVGMAGAPGAASLGDAGQLCLLSLLLAVTRECDVFLRNHCVVVLGS